MLTLAQELGVDDLQNSCEEHVTSTMSVLNACTFLAAAMDIQDRASSKYLNILHNLFVHFEILIFLYVYRFECTNSYIIVYINLCINSSNERCNAPTFCRISLTVSLVHPSKRQKCNFAFNFEPCVNTVVFKCTKIDLKS